MNKQTSERPLTGSSSSLFCIGIMSSPVLSDAWTLIDGAEVVSPPLRHLDIVVLQRKENHQRRNGHSSIQSCRHHIVVLGPPSEIFAPDHKVENEADKGPGGHDRCASRGERTTTEHERSHVHILNPRVWVLAREQVEW